MSGNPTLDAANASTGTEPLNTAPPGPQTPQQPSLNDEPPTQLTSLPSGFEPVVFPLELGDRTKNNQTLSSSSLPSANQFEDLVKAKTRPPGPSRAEEIGVEGVEKEVLEKVKGVVEGGRVKGYRVETGVGKGEVYVVGLDLDGERLVGVRVLGS